MSTSRRTTAVLGLALVLFAAWNGSAATAADPLKLLIIDGQNNHDWKTMTPPMKASLEATGRFTVDVATTPDKSAAKETWYSFHPEFSKYDVVLSNYNGQPWPERVQKSLEDYVSNGGGLVVVHAANNAFEGWPEWNKMIGLGWRKNTFGDRLTIDDAGNVVRAPKGEGPDSSHGPPHVYKIKVRDPEHPVMKGMPAEWTHAKDELYHGQRGPAENMHILATAYSSSEFKGTGTNEPMIWVIPYGKGRVFTTVMGHVFPNQTEAIRCVGFQTVVARGSEWAATGKVTVPIPSDFPRDQPRLSPPQ